MPTANRQTIPIRSNDDVVWVRRTTREFLEVRKFSVIDQTKMVTAASELARNTLLHGGGGEVTIEEIKKEARIGVKIVFRDEGPGIADVDKAMQDGYTTGEGLGLGLGGSKRLVNEFEINTSLGEGTTITIIRWR
jgi:serine/threonine-protein kinase RsbT